MHTEIASLLPNLPTGSLHCLVDSKSFESKFLVNISIVSLVTGYRLAYLNLDKTTERMWLCT